MSHAIENNKKLLILGCGGHARSVADIALSNGYKELVFMDNLAKKNERLWSFCVVQNLNGEKLPVIIGVGNNYKRAEIYKEIFANKYEIISLISQNAYLGKNAQIMPGSFVGEGAHIGPNARVGQNTIINTHSVIEHDCLIGCHSHVSVNATVAGGSTIHDFCMIGVGATIIDNINICSNVIIGAGAVVVKDIIEPGTYVGVPAKRIK